MWLRRLLFILPAAIFIVAAVVFAIGLTSDRQPDSIPSVLIDKPAPDFSLPPIEGLDLPGLATADLKGAPVTVVNVWASWCLPCKAEHPLLMRLAQQPGVRLVGINSNDKPEDARAFLAGLGNPFAAIGADRNMRVGIDWGISGVPETFFLDREGVIRYRHVGAIDEVTLKDTLLPIVEAIGK